MRDPGARPRATVLVFPGSNGERDLAEAFADAGFEVSYAGSDQNLEDAEVLGLPGGFSFGDYWRAGVLASKERALAKLTTHVERGGFVIGICNGFQILVEAGVLPGALTYNSPPGFKHSWVEVEPTDEGRRSPWLAGVKGPLRIPRAHGEGGYLHPEGEVGARQASALRYLDNPNGSMADVAAVLDPTGRVLGIMPHPERAIHPSLGSEAGKEIFASLYTHLRTEAGGTA